MGMIRLAPWQKTAVLAITALLVVGGAAIFWLKDSGSDVDTQPTQDMPTVPQAVFAQPASVGYPPPGIDPKASTTAIVKHLKADGIPPVALAAYRRAESLLGATDGACHLPWTLVAAIGRVESNHGRIDGNHVDESGIARPGLIGSPLNGNGVPQVSDTDDGHLDNDVTWDRPVGPFEILPGTWGLVGADSDGNGVKNPQSLYDAALTAGVYLCSGVGDLTKVSDARAALLHYNTSPSYASLVLAISDAYAKGGLAKTAKPTSKPTKSPEPSPEPNKAPTTEAPVFPSPTPTVTHTTTPTRTTPSRPRTTTPKPTTPAPTSGGDPRCTGVFVLLHPEICG